MSAADSQRRFALPTTGTLVVLGAAACALWLGWGELCERGWVPWVEPPLNKAVVRIQTVESLVRLGTRGVPELVEACSDRDPKVRRAALLGLRRLGPLAGGALETVTRALGDPDAGVRENAGCAFCAISRDPGAIGRVVARLLADADKGVRDAAATALRIGGPDCVEPLLDALGREPASLRMWAFEALARMPWNRDDAVLLALERLSQGPDDDVRIEAIMMLVDRNAASREQIQELLRADYTAQHEKGTLRSQDVALEAITWLDPAAAAELFPDVLAVLMELEQPDSVGGQDRQPGVPRYGKEWRFQKVLQALSTMGLAARDAVPHLLAWLQGSDDSLRRLPALRTLVDIGADADDVVPLLLPLLAEPNTNEPDLIGAGGLLAEIRPDEARRQVALLLPQLADPSSPSGLAALRAIYGMGREAEAAVPLLAELMANDEPHAVSLAAGALGRIGSRAAPAVPRIIERLGRLGGYPVFDAERVVDAVGEIGPGARLAVPSLLELIALAAASRPSNDDAWRRLAERAAVALARVGLADKKVLGALRDAMLGPALRARIAALQALVALSPDPRSLLADCLQLLGADEDPELHFELLLAIGDLDTERSDAIGPLVDALGDSEPAIRVVAAMTLGKIGPPAREAVPALREALLERRNAENLDRGGRFLLSHRLREIADKVPVPRSVAEAVRQALDRIEPDER